MKTVGEFKKAGLVFVNGDVYCHKGSTLKMLADGITLKWFERDAKALNATIMGFAWRENTGVKPKFSGDIEFTFNGEGCEMQEVRSANNINWSIVKKWRPSLNQSSVAESDTKQSAIHKAWVDLNGDLSNAEKHDSGGKFLVVCIKDGIAIKKGEYQIASHTTNNTEYWENVCTIPEFTSYCEKIAAEEKRMNIICQNGNEGLHYDNTAQQVEALAMKQPSEKMKVALKEADDISGGFITRCLVFKPADKPIFTQAMADAGELPPVGSLFIDIEYNESKQVLALAHHLGKVVYAADYDDVSQVDYFHADQDECKPIDMRTEIDKAIDAAMTDIGAEHGDRASVASVVECMIAAGYSKC
ncbi:hypothetical protein [Shewanella sp.]|uniref:hypothetical protein n=1 Tax=Shewanella sp. TaxID=50422 RepID=UPI001B68E7C0|nr:hypothetical protein [Shewanella sp.]MBP6517881.1 hypothetical protein [Shewanella sp.]